MYILLLVALAFAQASPPDYARALPVMVDAGISWARTNDSWAEGPISVDVESYMSALGQAGATVKDRESFTTRTGFQRSRAREDVTECTTQLHCVIRGGGVHVRLQSVKMATDSILEGVLGVSVTTDRGKTSGVCTLLLDVRAHADEHGGWATPKVSLIRGC